MSHDLVTVDLPASVTAADGAGGLPVLRVSTPVATGEVYLHGAHVTAYTPAGQDPVIWMSRASVFAPEQPIRGGVPICFPWFGPGREPGMSPAHGFARLADWTLVGAEDADGVVTLTFRLTEADVAGLPGSGVWRFPFELTYAVTFGPELTLVPHGAQHRHRGLLLRGGAAQLLPRPRRHRRQRRGARRRRLPGQGGRGAARRPVRPGDLHRGDGPGLPLRGHGHRRRPGCARAVTVAKEASANTVVWNPWSAKAAAMPDYDDAEWPTMVCVETANALEDAIALRAGQSHTMTARIAVTSA